MLGLNFDKLLIIGIIALVLIGPDRLPGYAAKLGQFVRSLRDMANGAKSRLRDEMGPEFDDIDWRQLDPRQYDPRRIIRDALRDEVVGPPPEAVAAAVTRPQRESAYAQRQRHLKEGRPAPFDAEAT